MATREPGQRSSWSNASSQHFHYSPEGWARSRSLARRREQRTCRRLGARLNHGGVFGAELFGPELRTPPISPTGGLAGDRSCHDPLRDAGSDPNGRAVEHRPSIYGRRKH
jgi:hypothetical protein